MSGRRRSSPSKRRRVDGPDGDDGEDHDPQRQWMTVPPLQAPPSSYGENSAASFPSRRSSSPRKQLIALQLHGEFERCQLDKALLPRKAQLLVSAFQAVSKGLDILPGSERPRVLQSRLYVRSERKMWQQAFRSTPCSDKHDEKYSQQTDKRGKQREAHGADVGDGDHKDEEEDEDDEMDRLFSSLQRFGRIPSPDEVQRLVQLARMCYNEGHDEVSWNMLVHGALLQSVLGTPGLDAGTDDGALSQGDGCDQENHLPSLNFLPCQTARPTRTYLPAAASSGKMVDFCLCLSPSGVDQAAEAASIDLLRRRLAPGGAVNHTDHRPLSRRPIAVAIETKRADEPGEKAQLQIGVWHAAHWRFLRYVVATDNRRSNIDVRGKDAATATSMPGEVEDQQDVEIEERREKPAKKSEEANATDHPPDVLRMLDFMPGIIIHGHSWHLVLSTLDGHKVILWTELRFGSTQSALEVYQIVAGLQILSAWSKQTYWPWFREWCLGLQQRATTAKDAVHALYT